MATNAPAAVQRTVVKDVTSAAVAVRRLETTVGTLLNFPALTNGWALVAATSIGYGVEKVRHTLGRTPVGYLVVASQAPRPVPGLVAADASFLQLDFGAVAGTLTLLIW